jgi:hypothetical protein
LREHEGSEGFAREGALLVKHDPIEILVQADLALFIALISETEGGGE